VAVAARTSRPAGLLVALEGGSATGMLWGQAPRDHEPDRTGLGQGGAPLDLLPQAGVSARARMLLWCDDPA
jgi:hypothetical protein